MIENLDSEVSKAVQSYWETRNRQADDHRSSTNITSGRRGDVTGGNHLDAFASLIERILIEAGVPRSSVKHDYSATLPGFYRPEKRWDTAVVHNGELLAVIEYKSQGSAFGKNLNNRSEEAVGSFTDLLEAYQEGLFKPSPAPWTGYLYLMVDNRKSRETPQPRETHFNVDDEFRDATHLERAELFCLRLVRQRLVNEAAFILSDEERGLNGEYSEPNQELRFKRFAQSLASHVDGHIDLQQDTLDV